MGLRPTSFGLEGREERSGIVSDTSERVADRNGLSGVQQNASVHETRTVASQIVEAKGAHRLTEIVRCDTLELMRLVDDSVRVVGDHFAEVILPNGRIGAE